MAKQSPTLVPRLHRNFSFNNLDELVEAVNNRDHYTRQHSEEVASYALTIAEAMGLSDKSARTLRMAGLLHDVGKIDIPEAILQKPGPLEELAIMQQHPQIGAMIITELPDISEVVEAVSCHHERLDGKGYPRGLGSNDIPLLGRILAVADTYSAMTTDRPYRKALTPEEAQEELRRVAGSQLDRQILEVFLQGLQADPEQVHRLTG